LSVKKRRVKYTTKKQALSYNYFKNLIIYFLLIVGLFPGLFGLIGIYNESKKELISSKGLYFKEVALSTAFQVEKILEEKIEAIKRLTLSPSLQFILTLPVDKTHREIKNFKRIFVPEMIKKDIVFNIYNKAGKMVYSTNDTKIGTSVPHAIGAINNEGLMYISDVVKTENSVNQFHIEIFAPIKDENDRNIGTIQAIYIVDQLFNTVKGVKIGTTGHANLVDSSGTILICPVFQARSHRITNDLLRVLLDHSAGWSIVDDDAHGSRGSIIGYAPINLRKEGLHSASFGKRDWYIFTLQSPIETFASVHKFKSSSIVYAVILIVLVLLLCLLALRQILKAQKAHELDIKHIEKTEAAKLFMSNFQQLMLNPLDKLKAWLDKVENHNNSEELKPKAIRAIRQHLSFLESMTRHLSFYSKTNAIKLELVELSQLVTTSLSLLEYMLSSHTTKVIFDKSKGPIILAGEPQLLSIVVINIILNAIHAINGNGIINITLHKSGKWGIFRIIDNGCGISDEEIEYVFDPLYTTKKGHKGYGLGLSVSRSIIEGHDGEITVKSTKGEGTSVEVKLRLANDAELEASQRKSTDTNLVSPI